MAASLWRYRWTVALVATLAIGCVLRVIALGRLPGLHGDEAWYGVNVQALLAGDTPFVRTPSGNLLNVWHSVPLLLFSLVSAPSTAVLRLPSAMWGIIAVLIAFPLLRQPLGDRGARAAAMLIAVSPMMIAASRFGWDPSDIPLAVLLAVGWALRDQPWPAGIALVASLLIHPVSVFAAPFVLAAWMPGALRRHAAASAPVRQRTRRVLVSLGVAGLAAGWLVLRNAALDDGTLFPSVSMVVDRLASPRTWLTLVIGIVELLSGIITSTFVAGPVAPPVRVVADVFAATVLVGPLVLGWRWLRTAHHSRVPWLVAGLAIGIGAMHVMVGPRVFLPGYERYAMALVIPLIILCAIGLDGWASRSSRANWAIGVACVGFLTIAITTYFLPLRHGGNAVEAAYRTGNVEPKVAAFDYIVRDSTGRGTVRIVAEEWTLYWTLRYLAADQPRMHVELPSGVTAFGGVRPAGVQPPHYGEPDGEYQVTWQVNGAAPGGSGFISRDPRGRPILEVRRVRP